LSFHHLPILLKGYWFTQALARNTRGPLTKSARFDWLSWSVTPEDVANISSITVQTFSFVLSSENSSGAINGFALSDSISMNVHSKFQFSRDN
jgi:hypothetical protein